MEALELILLKLWEQNQVKYVYKYKNRIKSFKREGLSTPTLFYDITCKMFPELEDIADKDVLYPIHCKVSVKELIERREIRHGVSNSNG